MKLILPLLALALVAGCTTPPEDVGPAATDVAAEAPELATNATAVVNDSAAMLFEHPFTHDGKVPAFAEACLWALVTIQCYNVPPTADYKTAVTQPEVMGSLVSGKVTATWTPSDPTHQQMVLFAYSIKGDEFVGHGIISGSTGLTLDLEAVEEFAPGGTLTIGLRPAGRSASVPVGGAWTLVSPTEQPFKLDGLLVVQH